LFTFKTPPFSPEGKKNIPILERRLTPTLWACTEPAMVTHGTPMYRDSHVVVVPAYGKVSRLSSRKKEEKKK
jgi:hypothetical protein